MAAHVHIKICCISSEQEAAFAVSVGASAIGLVSSMPSGPGPIPDARIAAIARTVPSHIHTFLLTSRRRPADIAAHFRAMGTTVIQIVDSLEEGTHAELRDAVPNAKLVQVIHVTGPESIEQAVTAASFVDALLLDSGRPFAAVKQLGGTGRVHDWSISRVIRESVTVPVLLAGGLRADNVAQAIAAVRPYGVDVCSGVRTAGSLDPVKVRAFVDAVGGSLGTARESMFA